MEKKEAAEAMKKIGPLKFIKGYNRLCRRCKLLSIRLVQQGRQEEAWNKYCDRCKSILEKIQ